jgi:hypothetical protein
MYTFDENIVSDLHKDARGFRPHQDWWYVWESVGDRGKQRIWDSLCDELDAEVKREELEQARALAKLLDRILDTMKLGADDQKTAIKWIIEAEEFSDYDLQYGADYFCYHFGLSYQVKNQLPIQEAMNEMLAEVV